MKQKKKKDFPEEIQVAVGRVNGRRRGVGSKNNTKPFHHFLCGAEVSGILTSWAQGPPYGPLSTRDVRMV